MDGTLGEKERGRTRWKTRTVVVAADATRDAFLTKTKEVLRLIRGQRGREQASCPLITSLVAPNERRTEEGMRQSFLGKQSGRFVNQPSVRPFRLHDVGPLRPLSQRISTQKKMTSSHFLPSDEAVARSPHGGRGESIAVQKNKMFNGHRCRR